MCPPNGEWKAYIRNDFFRACAVVLTGHHPTHPIGSMICMTRSPRLWLRPSLCVFQSDNPPTGRRAWRPQECDAEAAASAHSAPNGRGSVSMLEKPGTRLAQLSRTCDQCLVNLSATRGWMWQKRHVQRMSDAPGVGHKICSRRSMYGSGEGL